MTLEQSKQLYELVLDEVNAKEYIINDKTYNGLPMRYNREQRKFLVGEDVIA